MKIRTKPNFFAVDFPLQTRRANLAEITLKGRYPEKGFALNTRSEMIVYVVKGRVSFTQGKKKVLKKGYAVLVKTNQKYFWKPDGKVTIAVFSSPPWNPEQHKLVG